MVDDDIMIFMLKKVQNLVILVLLWVSLPIFLLVTNPDSLPLPMLIVPFILVLLALYKTTQTILSIGSTRLSPKKIRLMSGTVAVLPTVLLTLASIGQLTVRDSAIVFGLLILLTFYMRRLDFLKI